MGSVARTDPIYPRIRNFAQCLARDLSRHGGIPQLCVPTASFSMMSSVLPYEDSRYPRPPSVCHSSNHVSYQSGSLIYVQPRNETVICSHPCTNSCPPSCRAREILRKWWRKYQRVGTLRLRVYCLSINTCCCKPNPGLFRYHPVHRIPHVLNDILASLTYCVNRGSRGVSYGKTRLSLSVTN